MRFERGASVAVSLALLWASGAAAQGMTQEERIQTILRDQVIPILADLDVIMLKAPEYLAQRLPAMQSGGDLGAQMDLVQLGQFSVTLGLLAGVFRDFDDIGNDFQRMPNQLPDPLPIPAAVVGVRMAVHRDWEVGARYGFFPEFEVKSQGWLIRGTTSIYGLRGRNRTLEGQGWKPTLVSSADLSYFTGSMDIGRDFTFTMGDTTQLLDPAQIPVLNEAVNQEVFGGDRVLGPSEPMDLGIFFRGAPIIGWDIYQLTLEERAVWDLSFWHPFLGLGIDFASGHVDSGIRGLKVDTRATGPGHLLAELKERDIRPTILELLPDQNVTIKSEKPRSVSGRVIGGMEFDLGQAVRLALESQFDFGTYSAVGAFGVRYAYR